VAVARASQKPPEPVSFTIDMTEYAFSPNELNVSVGQEVTLTLVNKGTLEHEIMFGRDVMTTDGRPNGFTVDLFEHGGVEPEVQGGMLMIDGEMVMGVDHTEEMAENMNGEMDMGMK
jgi:plastocyanin